MKYIVLLFLLLTLNIFHFFFECFYCWLWTSKCSLGSGIKWVYPFFLIVTEHILVHRLNMLYNYCDVYYWKFSCGIYCKIDIFLGTPIEIRLECIHFHDDKYFLQEELIVYFVCFSWIILIIHSEIIIMKYN